MCLPCKAFHLFGKHIHTLPYTYVFCCLWNITERKWVLLQITVLGSPLLASSLGMRTSSSRDKPYLSSIRRGCTGVCSLVSWKHQLCTRERSNTRTSAVRWGAAGLIRSPDVAPGTVTPPGFTCGGCASRLSPYKSPFFLSWWCPGFQGWFWHLHLQTRNADECLEGGRRF